MPSFTGANAPNNLRRSVAILIFVGLIFTSFGVQVEAQDPPTGSIDDVQLALSTNWNVGGWPRSCESDGAGGWANCVNVPITDGSPDGTSTVEAGDWNNDGVLDVVIGNQNGTLNSCIRQGTNDWVCTSNGATGRHRGIGVGDFNGDGSMEFVGAIETGPLMDVCLNDGSGNFTCNRVAAPNGGRDIVVGDYNNDGNADLAYAAFPGPSAVCLNDGTGVFTCNAIAGSGNNFGVDQGDLNQDGIADLVLPGGGTTDELLCLGSGTGTFACNPFNTGGFHSQAKIGDLNNDNLLDVLVAGDGTDHLACFGDGAGALSCSPSAAAPTNAQAVELGHIDTDGVLDALFGLTGVTPNQACFGMGDGNFSCGDVDPAFVMNTQGVLLLGDPTVADVDNDGVDDATDNCVTIANPAQEDFDSDLVGDACDADDDGDGLDDMDESVYLTDPLNPDSDFDSLNDFDEIFQFGTNPNLVDTDGDTVDDALEIAQGSDPLTPPLPQSVAVMNVADITFDVGSFTVNAFSDSLLPVTFSTAGPCTIVGNVASANGVGTCTVFADQPGDLTFAPALTASIDVEILPGVQGIFHDPVPGLTFGDPAHQLSAYATSGLPVEASTTGPCVVSGLELSVTGAGTCLLTFAQPGDANWDAANQVTTSFDIAPANQLLDVTPIIDRFFDEPAVAAEASATSGLDPIFSTSGSCLADGPSIEPIGAGSCEVTVEQPGNANWNPAPAETFTFSVAPGRQNIAFDSPEGIVFGQQPLAISPIASSGLPIDIGASGSCTNEGSTITPTGAGDCVVVLEQLGNANWQPAPTITTTFPIARGLQTLSLDVVDSTTFGSSPVNVLATSTSGLQVDISVAGSCSYADGEIELLGAGVCTVSASQSGDADWNAAAPINSEVTIAKAPQSITFDAPLLAIDSAPIAVPGAATSGLPVTWNTNGACSLINGTLVPETVGLCEVRGTQDGDANYLPAPEIATTFNVALASAELTVARTTVGFTGEAQPVIASSTPVDVGEITVTYDGSVDVPTDPGIYELVVTLNSVDYVAPSVSTTYTVLEAPESDELGFDPDDAEVRFISLGVDEIVENGLPEPSDANTALTVTGLEFGTVVQLADDTEEIEVVVADTEVAVLGIPASFDLADAIFMLDFPNQPDVVVSTQEIARMANAEVFVDIQANEGDQVGGTTVQVIGDGLVPGSSALAVVHSDPIEIGRISANEQGGFTSALELPSELVPGEHRVLIQAETPDGLLTGTWFFAVDRDGSLDRVGDPVPLVATSDPIPESIPFVDEAPASALAQAEPEAEPENQALDSDPVTVVVIDEATGLVVYDPVAEPEQTVESGVNGFTLVTVVTAAAGSVAALGSIGTAMPSSTVTSSAGAASTARSGSSGPGGNRRRSSSSGGGEDEKSRGKGKIASGKSSGMGDGIDSRAWGDTSSTWRWPLVAVVDNLSRRIPNAVRPFSPLAARIASDGSTLRALLGTGWLLSPVVGVALGLWAVVDTQGTAVAPAAGLVIALIALGIFDAMAGATAALTFAVGVAVLGGIVSPDSIRTVMGVGSLWYAVALIAGGARKFRRPPAETWEDRWTHIADLIIGPLLGAWAVQTVLKALPGLAGLDLPIAADADRIALIALVLLVVRYLVERLSIRLYPARMALTAPIEESAAGSKQRLASLMLKAATFTFIIEPFIGIGWPLGVVVTLMIVPGLLGLVEDKFPNSALLNRVKFSGVPAILFFLVLGSTIAGALADRIEDPATLTATSFVVLSIPGFVSSILGLFGRKGGKFDTSWVGRFAGTLVTLVAFAAVRKIIDLPLINWVPFAVAPAFLWWVARAWSADFEDLSESEEVSEDEEDDEDEDDTGRERLASAA